MVALNRAVAVAEVDGPEVALALVEPLAARVVPRLARDPGRPAAPAADGTTRRASAYDRAIELAGNEEERAFLRARPAPLLPA